MRKRAIRRSTRRTNRCGKEVWDAGWRMSSRRKGPRGRDIVGPMSRFGRTASRSAEFLFVLLLGVTSKTASRATRAIDGYQARRTERLTCTHDQPALTEISARFAAASEIDTMSHPRGRAQLQSIAGDCLIWIALLILTTEGIAIAESSQIQSKRADEEQPVAHRESR